MRALIQRVSEASVSIDGEVVGAIGPGLLVLLGVSRDDTDKDASYIVTKVVNLRIFSDDEGKFQSSATDIGAELLVVSQFTLCANTRKGKRPSFINAAAPETAEKIYYQFCVRLQKKNIPVKMGRFGAMMKVELINDGPVTIIIDSKEKY